MVHGAAELDADLRIRLCLKIGRSSVRAAVATRESDAPQKSNVKLRDIAAHVVTQSNEPRHVMGASGGTSPATVDPAHSAALRRRRHGPTGDRCHPRVAPTRPSPPALVLDRSASRWPRCRVKQLGKEVAFSARPAAFVRRETGTGVNYLGRCGNPIAGPRSFRPRLRRARASEGRDRGNTEVRGNFHRQRWPGTGVSDGSSPVLPRDGRRALGSPACRRLSTANPTDRRREQGSALLALCRPQPSAWPVLSVRCPAPWSCVNAAHL